jgi:hypothetical protein
MRREGKGVDALCEINIEEIEIQSRLNDACRYRDRVYVSFCVISVGQQGGEGLGQLVVDVVD